MREVVLNELFIVLHAGGTNIDLTEFAFHTPQPSMPFLRDKGQTGRLLTAETSKSKSIEESGSASDGSKNFLQCRDPHGHVSNPPILADLLGRGLGNSVP